MKKKTLGTSLGSFIQTEIQAHNSSVLIPK